MPNETKRRWVDNEAKQQQLLKKRKEGKSNEKKKKLNTEECHCALLQLSKLIVIFVLFLLCFWIVWFPRFAIYGNASLWLFFGFRFHNNNMSEDRRKKQYRKNRPMNHESIIVIESVFYWQKYLFQMTLRIKTVFFVCETKRKRKKKKRRINQWTVHVHNK